ncbi:MAG: hypothetical protein NTV63_05110 [Candidatus Woesearchaeota archaeon]|nr:hypothetical protein [Candidatus Woesearchaeota archaeon]
MIDIVIPKDNEEEFIRIAQRIGIKGLCFLYQPKEFLDRKKALAGITEKTKPQIRILSGLILDATKAKQFSLDKKISAESDIVAARGLSKSFFDAKGIDMIFGLESQKKDFAISRNSGLNQVLCNSARKKGIAIGLSLSEILLSENSERADIIGRIMQNIFLCRKYGVKIKIASFAQNPILLRRQNDIRSLFQAIGLSSEDALQAFEPGFGKKKE